MSRIIENVDVICQHKADGDIIPIKFRFMNEDKEYETYKICGYRRLSGPGTYTTPDGLLVSGTTFIFECLVIVLDNKRKVRLYFERNNCKWRLGL
ncbi:MAG: hypothetical protein K6F84_00050 [Lachnospiraceae bacterium]|nr:hypothetical protein [Lachnospiraceae bacterium]